MENFYNWMTSPIPNDEVTVWFNIHNMIYEKIELFGDMFKTLNILINDTYLGNGISETKIEYTQEDKSKHFEWCWNKTLELFAKENILIKSSGEHKDYFEDFFMETFYNQAENSVKTGITKFISEIFDVQKLFTKSDLEILTEIYKLLDKNMK